MLYRNNGDGTFTDVTKEAGLLHKARPLELRLHLDRLRSATAIWICLSANYLDFDIAAYAEAGRHGDCIYLRRSPSCAVRAASLQPRQYLYHNNGDGTFTRCQRGLRASPKARSSFAMSAVAADFDNDGWPDIFVACDSTPSFFFHNNHDGTFHEEALERGIALSDDGHVQAGMGVGIGDCNLDGNLDLFKTHFRDDTNDLYLNDGKGNFDIATTARRPRRRDPICGWGAGIVDLDNDGWPDIFMVTGSPYPGIEKHLPAHGRIERRA